MGMGVWSEMRRAGFYHVIRRKAYQLATFVFVQLRDRLVRTFNQIISIKRLLILKAVPE